MGHKSIYGMLEKDVFSRENLTKIKVRYDVFSPKSHVDFLIPSSAMQKIALKILKVVAIVTHPGIKNGIVFLYVTITSAGWYSRNIILKIIIIKKNTR